MTSLRARALVLLFAVLMAAPLLPGAASADEPSGTALARLTDKERTVLEARVPHWADLGSAQKEKIAANVIRLRTLSPEERRRLDRRIGALERHRRVHGRLPHGFGRLRDRPAVREELRRRGRVVHAAGVRMWASLPDEVRARAEDTLSGRDRAAFERAFFHRFWTAKAQKLTEGPLQDLVVPEPPIAAWADRLEDLHRRAGDGDVRAKRQLAFVVLASRMRAFAQGLPQGADEDAALHLVGTRIRDDDPALFAASVDEAREALADPAALEAWLDRAGGRGDREAGPGREREALERLKEALREAWPSLQADPRLKEAAGRLRRLLER